jgi:hypothetical protein
VRTYIEHLSVKKCFCSEKDNSNQIEQRCIYIESVNLSAECFTEWVFLVGTQKNYTVEYSFEHMSGSLPAQSQQMYSSLPELNDTWTKVSYKRSRSRQEGTEREAKHTKKTNTGSTKLPLPIATQFC